MEKKRMRNKMKETLHTITEEEYKRKSFKIHELLYSTDIWETASTVAVTLSRFPEVSTKELIEEAWKLGKKVVVPKCNPKDHSMSFYYLSNFDQLETVYFGLLEPIVSQSVYCNSDQIELMIVPGVVFDKKGYRIGHGGGYYDRYLTGFLGKTLSLAFHEQLISNVPTEAHDIPVEWIITDEAIYECATR